MRCILCDKQTKNGQEICDECDKLLTQEFEEMQDSEYDDMNDWREE